jgi:hypothetical protein
MHQFINIDSSKFYSKAAGISDSDPNSGILLDPDLVVAESVLNPSLNVD